jgi:ATP-binding cassette subfamily C (CFTR/MRP) protein 1
MGVFGRDFDVIDNTLPESLRNVIITVANVIGSIILITVFEHYFIIVGSKITTVSCAKAN